MSDVINGIVKWTEDRKMGDVDDSSVVFCILEELLEYLGINGSNGKKTAMAYRTHLMQEAEALGYSTSEHEQVDALADILVFCVNFLHRKGYEPNKVMNETLREISSREQDHSQMMQWIKYGSNGEKWKKNLEQLTETLYKADYTNCRIA